MGSTGARSRTSGRIEGGAGAWPGRLGPACRFGFRFSRFQWVAAPFGRPAWPGLRADPWGEGLAHAAHGPDFAAHVDEVKAAPREFAPGHDVAAVDRRPGVRRGVFDLVTVSGMEMLHCCLRSSAAIERVLRQTAPRWTGGRAFSASYCAAQFHAAMHGAQAEVGALPAGVLKVLHPC